MIKMINCTVDDYAWVMEGADPPVPRCQNQSESYATIKASYEYEYSLQNISNIIVYYAEYSPNWQVYLLFYRVSYLILLETAKLPACGPTSHLILWTMMIHN